MAILTPIAPQGKSWGLMQKAWSSTASSIFGDDSGQRAAASAPGLPPASESTPLRGEAAAQVAPTAAAETADAALSAARAAAAKAEVVAAAAKEAALVSALRAPALSAASRDADAAWVGAVHVAKVSRQQRHLEEAFKRFESDERALSRRLRGGLQSSWEACRAPSAAVRDRFLAQAAGDIQEDFNGGLPSLKGEIGRVRREQRRLKKALLESAAGSLYPAPGAIL